MKRGISINRDYDYQGVPCVVIKKKRGKLTLPEITDTLHYGDHQCWVGRYVILLDCTEVTMGGNGCLDMMDEEPGDAVVLYQLEEGEPCPVCNTSLPPFQYCPTCGSAWAENGTNIETLLTAMQQEASRNIKNPLQRHHAWRGTGRTSAPLTSPGSWASFRKSAGRNSMKRCGRSSRPQQFLGIQKG